MLIQSILTEVQKLAKERNITVTEAIQQLKQFKKDFNIFKARLELVKNLEINCKEYKSSAEIEGYLILNTKEDILKYILNLRDRCVSFKVTFKNGTFYAYYQSGHRVYSTDYNKIVVDFIIKYI